MRNRIVRTDSYGHSHRLTPIEWVLVHSGIIRSSARPAWYRPFLKLGILLVLLVLELPIAWVIVKISSN